MTLPDPFTAIRRTRSFDEVVMQVQDAVMTRRFEPGERLPSERALSETFEVSRPTLREALRALEVLGVLEIRAGKGGGIFVAEPTGEGVGSALAALIHLRGATPTELNEFRESFEGETAAWAARRADPEDVERLAEIARDVSALAQLADTRWAEIVPLDVAFHEAVAQASKNRVRVAVMLGLLRAIERVELTITDLADVQLHKLVGKHLTAIAQAIGDHDAEGARLAMKTHVDRFGDLYVRAAPAGPTA